MSDAPPKDDARKLAEWTQLDTALLRVLWPGLRRRAPGLPSFEVASTEEVSDDDAVAEPFRSILALCRAAQRVGALDDFCIDVVGVEQEVGGRSPGEVDAILKAISYAGQLQGITDRARGKAHPRIFYKLTKIFEATAYIEDQIGFRGTGFLVRKDKVLTAAHVALECSKDERGAVIFSDRARAGLRVIFPAAWDKQSARLDAVRPLLHFGHPYTNSTGKLIKQVSSEAAGKLDFAVLLLDRMIVGVEPLSIEGLDYPSIGPLSFVIGYPGGTDPAFDADTLVRHEHQGHRLILMMNARPGMSGSCCTGDGGIPVGLHEGELPVLGPHLKPERNADGSEKKENRAVLLSAIAKNIRDHDPNLLDGTRHAPGVAIFDRELVQRLGKRGQQLADEETRARWEMMFAKVIGVSPSEPSGTWALHPWFARDKARKRLQAWFQAAARPESGDRVVFVSGPDGSGKTFSVDILAALLAAPARDLFRIEGIAESRSLDLVADHLITREVATTVTRTAEGRVKYDTVEDIVDALATLGGRNRARDPTAHPLFVAIDAGEAADAIIGATEWVELVVAVAARPWARVVICGLSPETEHRFMEALKSDPSTRLLDPETVLLEHVTATDIEAFLKAHHRLDGRPFDDAYDLAKSFDGPTLLHGIWKPLTTAEAALMSIMLLKDTTGAAAGNDQRGPA